MQPDQSDTKNTKSTAPATHPGRLSPGWILLLILLALVLLASSLLEAGVITLSFLPQGSTQAGVSVPPSSTSVVTTLSGRLAAPNLPTRASPSPIQPTPTLVPFAGDPVASRPAPSNLTSSMRYYTETGHVVSGDFFNFYRGTVSASDLFGLPLTEAFAEKLPDGHVYQVQYFERARMEYHPELPSGQQVQLGALTPLALGSRLFERAPAGSTSTSTSLYFPQTGHTIAGGFLTYWQANGGLRVFGLPLSQEVGEDGIVVQYFERARMEYHADLLGTGSAIQLSPVGYTALKTEGRNLPMGTLVRFDPPQLAEGHTTTLEVAASPAVTVTGRYEGRSLFFEHDAQHGTAWAVLGAVPFADLGGHTVSISFESGDGGRRTVTRTLEIKPYPFPEESLQFDPTTASLLDPKLTQPELDTLNGIFAGRTPEQYWDGKFKMPLDGSIRITSYFATRRCYNCPDGSKPTTYHGGLDMAANEGTPVHAPAGGKVVFAGKLAVRGNAIIIDHGLGVYSLFAHNSKLVAQVGQTVKKGDVVSLSGNTGLSNGPHLHWELHVSGPPVEPLEWVNRVMP